MSIFQNQTVLVSPLPEGSDAVGFCGLTGMLSDLACFNQDVYNLLNIFFLFLCTIYIIGEDLTAECSRPIAMSPFCPRHTRKHNFQVIK